MKHMRAVDFEAQIKKAICVLFDRDGGSMYPDRIIIDLASEGRIVIAAREDGCLDVVLEEA